MAGWDSHKIGAAHFLSARLPARPLPPGYLWDDSVRSAPLLFSWINGRVLLPVPPLTVPDF